MNIRFADLFAGIGGFRLGIQRAAEKNGIGAECVFSCEKENHLRELYGRNFGDNPAGDIKQISADEIPDIDILCGGFPCQDVSALGKRTGLQGERTGLFFNIIRILHEKQPRIVFLENVTGLLNTNGGWDFARVLIELEDAGYRVEWCILDSAAFGVPQHRERVFIIGHLRGTRGSGFKVFPIREVSGVCDESIQSKKRLCSCLGTLTRRQYASWNGNFIRTDEGIRRLTPMECERAHGYPDNWTYGLSDKQRYECLGNTVTVNVIEAIAERVLKGFTNTTL